MRRWNGWGDDAVAFTLPCGAELYLQDQLGAGMRPRDASLSQVLACVPSSRLPAHPLICHDAAVRLRHARGQSLPDWVALRSGHIGAFPDGVAHPMTPSDVRELLRFAGEVGARVIPYGGGTSVVGHINPLDSPEPVLTVSLARMNRLLRLDEVSHLATFGAGVTGPDLEAQLRARGLTLGHYPQSFEYSSLGGWIATRSSGQQSLAYGRIERLFAGGRLESPAGRMELPVFPASAAGPDLRELVLGSEGRLGILTEATVRAAPLPEREEFYAVFLPGWEDGLVAARQMLQARLPLSMLRLSTAAETEAMLRLAGHPRLIGALERYLSWRGAGRDKCMLLGAFTGRRAVVKAARREAFRLVAAAGGTYAGRAFGRHWRARRFRSPYLRNTLWEMGYALDTVETAASWARIPELLEAVETSLRTHRAESGERVHVFSHMSHFYPDGGSLYTTLLFRVAPEPAETLRRWSGLKTAVSRAIVAHGGTISHQHGVGADHAEHLPAEKGELGMQVLHSVCSQFDPGAIMNPGKLLSSRVRPSGGVVA